MLSIKKHPHHLLIITACLLLVCSFFTGEETTDIHIHDTYYVIPLKHIFFWAVALLSIFWVIYLLTRRLLFSRTLARLHIIQMVVTALALMAVLAISSRYYQGFAGMPRRYYDHSRWNFFMILTNAEKGILVAGLLTLLGILIYLFNLATGIYKNK